MFICMLLIWGGIITLVVVAFNYFYDKKKVFWESRDSKLLKMQKLEDRKKEDQRYLDGMDHRIDVDDETFKRILIQQNRELIDAMREQNLLLDYYFKRHIDRIISHMILLFIILMVFIFFLPDLRALFQLEVLHQYLK